MKKFIDIILSFFQLTFQVILAPKAKVLFYYPQHFNRSAEGTNPFFDPLLKTCDKYDIKYKLIEEPDWGTDKPRNSNAIKGDAFFVLVMLFRKIVSKINPSNTFAQNDIIVARIVNIVTFGGFKFDKYVSISGSMEGLFLSLNKTASVFEIQHGIDYSNKVSYFRNGEIYESYRDLRWHLLSYGEGYRNCVIKGHEKELASRINVIGCPLQLFPKSNTMIPTSEKIILFSLQFTHDWNTKTLKLAKDLLVSTLEQLSCCDIQVLLKNHPRYNNSVSLDDVYKRFPFVSETHEQLAALQPKTLLHVTINSTTSFEYAVAGVPTFFMHSETDIPRQSLFYYEYKYPLFYDMSIQQVVEYLSSQENYQQASAEVKKWYLHFYSPYNENAFLQLIKQ